MSQDGMTLGRSDAAVTIHEYVDLQCIACSAAAPDTLPGVIDERLKAARQSSRSTTGRSSTRPTRLRLLGRRTPPVARTAPGSSSSFSTATRPPSAPDMSPTHSSTAWGRWRGWTSHCSTPTAAPPPSPTAFRRAPGARLWLPGNAFVRGHRVSPDARDRWRSTRQRPAVRGRGRGRHIGAGTNVISGSRDPVSCLAGDAGVNAHAPRSAPNPVSHLMRAVTHCG